MSDTAISYQPMPQYTPTSLSKIFRPTIGISELQRNTENAILSYEETNVLLETALMVLNCLPHVPTKGIIILDSWRQGEDANCILRATLEKGVKSESISYAERAIDTLLEPHSPEAKYLDSTGIHHIEIDRLVLRVMVLNTPRGRFLASIF